MAHFSGCCNSRPTISCCPDSLQWIDAKGGCIPHGAVVGGNECCGEPLYVARALHNCALTPGKAVRSHGCAYVAWGGQEHSKQVYQVLVGGPNCWVSACGRHIPPNAFPAGKSEGGETLYVGRVKHRGTVTPGKVQVSHGVCYIPYGGQELSFSEFEILTW